eukprot:11191606-Lingulodinium_polyedra.AAC.1
MACRRPERTMFEHLADIHILKKADGPQLEQEACRAKLVEACHQQSELQRELKDQPISMASCKLSAAQ